MKKYFLVFLISFSFSFVVSASNVLPYPKLSLRFQKVEKKSFRLIDQLYYVCKTGCKGAICVGVATTQEAASANADVAVLASCGFATIPVTSSF